MCGSLSAAVKVTFVVACGVGHDGHINLCNRIYVNNNSNSNKQSTTRRTKHPQ